MPSDQPLRIVHVFRAPTGGLFRHVLDLAAAQAAAGHQVGLICDSGGGERASAALSTLAPQLTLGVTRITMPREPGPSDAAALARVSVALLKARPDVVHGHGAKGGFYGRLAPARLWGRGPARIYTPHGGSAHYGEATTAGRLYGVIERTLARVTSVFTFESEYVARRFASMLGDAPHAAVVIHNGLAPHEFEPVLDAPDAADILFLGELRTLKGVDTLIEAMSLLRDLLPWEPSAVIVGAGPDEAAFRAQARQFGLRGVEFKAPMSARQAFALGRVMAVPSRAESLPYVVIEAAAAQRPLVATAVGGVPEILGPFSHRLVPADSPQHLATALAAVLLKREDERADDARQLAEHVAIHFAIDGMSTRIETAYRKALRG